MKVQLPLVIDVLKRYQLHPDQLKGIVHDIQAEVNAGESDEGKPPAQKKQFVILISDPDGEIPEKDFVGWVVQIPEMESVLTTEERIHKASYDFNASRRGRRNPVSTVGEACEAVPAKHFREAEVAIKTKIPVAVIVSSNQIPSDDNSPSYNTPSYNGIS